MESELVLELLLSHLSKSTVRKTQLSSGERKTQEAKAVSRKAMGIHNQANRVIPKPKGC